jgi:hypothetical protein
MVSGGTGHPLYQGGAHMGAKVSEIKQDDLLILKGNAGELKPSAKKQAKVQGQVREQAITIKRKEPLGLANQTYRLARPISKGQAEAIALGCYPVHLDQG